MFLEKNCEHRPVQYLNNVLEQDHRSIKRRINASQHFRSFWAAWRTIAGYEVIHMIRKAKRTGVWRVRGSVYCTASFSICSLRRTKFPIIYPAFRLDYKLATLPSGGPNSQANRIILSGESGFGVIGLWNREP